MASRTLLPAVLVAIGGFVALASPPAHAAPSLPSLPGAAAPSGSVDLEQLRRGIVQIEHGGRPVAVGTVLSKDGRVLTSLSGLGTVETAEVRYADNTVVKAKIGHKDKVWDLALLVPQSGKWLDGLMPTDADPTGVDLKAFLPKAGRLAASGIRVERRIAARSKEGDLLGSVLELDLKGLTAIPGAPLVDPSGKVMGVLVRACKPDGSPEASRDAAAPAQDGESKPEKKASPRRCAPVTVGAPVTAIRAFLMKTPTTATPPAPWLGLGGAPVESGSVKGVRVVGVAPGSPAEKAGLSAKPDAADVIVAVNGQPVETPEQLADAIGKHAVGQRVKLLVFTSGKFREAAVTLEAAPPAPKDPAQGGGAPALN